MTGWEPVERDACGRSSFPNSLFGGFNPFAEEIEGDWIVYAEQDDAAQAPRRRVPQRAELLRGGDAWRRSSDPPLRTEVLDDWTGTSDRVRDPEQTRYVWYAEVGADEHHDLGELPGRRPERGARRDQRAPLGLLPDRAPPRLHHRARLRAGAGGLPVDAADRRPARPHRPELGEGLDHRGQRHPRREVLGGLARQGGVDRPQLRDPARATSPATSTSSSRSSPRARSAGTGSTSARTSSAATRIYDCGQNGIVGHLGCVFSTIEDNHIYNIALKREFYGYEIGGIKLHAAIDVVIRHNRIHDCSLGDLARLADAGHARLAQPPLRQQPRPLRRGEPRAVPRRAQRPRVARVAGAVQPGRRVRQQPRVRDRAAPTRRRATDAVPRAAQHAGRRLRRDPRRRRPLHRQRLPRRRPRLGLWADLTLRGGRPATAPPATTGTPRRWPTTSPWSTTRPAATTSASRTSSRRSTSATTSTPRAPACTRASAIASSSTT